jgi:hypothetical protein
VSRGQLITVGDQALGVKGLLTFGGGGQPPGVDEYSCSIRE